jgi:hypothetical protein
MAAREWLPGVDAFRRLENCSDVSVQVTQVFLRHAGKSGSSRESGRKPSGCCTESSEQLTSGDGGRRLSGAAR